MKRMILIKNWLVAAMVIGVVGTHTVPIWAQDNEAAKTNATDIIDVVSDAAVDPEAMDVEETSQNWRGPVVVVGGSATLRTNESAEVVVAIGGSAKAGGKVRDAVVAIGGDAQADGKVGGAVVAVGGNAFARERVNDAVVAIAGDAQVRGEVREAVVAVFGDVIVGSNSVVHGDAVSVGGKVEVEPGGQVKGQVTEVGMGDHPLLAPLKGLADWVKHCAFKLRLLAPQAGWYWVVAGFFLLCYLLIVVAFPRPVAACVNEFAQRPVTTFLLGLLTKILVPLLFLLLAATGIGAIAVPFIWVAIFIGAMIGKAALFQYLGRVIVRIFGVQLSSPVLAVLIGLVIVTLLYMVPLLSLVIYIVTGIWGIGAAVTASFGRARRESPARSGSTPPSGSGIPSTAPLSPSSSNPASTPTADVGAAAFAASIPTSETASPSSVPPADTNPNPIPEPGLPPKPISVPFGPTVTSEALNLPRANFWERMGAGFLDIIILAIAVGLLPRFIHNLFGGASLFFLVALAYFTAMWSLKATTVGAIVLNLKVVRLDDQPVTFVVALVRGLAAMLSFVVLCLGFFWIIWDREKQGWHDKIAGTVVVRQPRGMPLVCL